MKSGSAFEALAVDVSDFSVAPCVQHQGAPNAAIASCCRLHEAGIAVALRGPLPELLGVIHQGFPLKVCRCRQYLLLLLLLLLLFLLLTAAAGCSCCCRFRLFLYVASVVRETLSVASGPPPCIGNVCNARHSMLTIVSSR